jgi:Protein of unknown function (DUF3750)
VVKVRLCYAPLPFIGAIAVHHWFIVEDGNACHRWEVWQTADAGGVSTGHVHCDLKPPEEDVGGGPTVVAAEWTGEEAARLKAVIDRAMDYPAAQLYRYWPGPNSNSFVAWILREAKVEHPLDWKGIGKDWRVG